VQRRLLQGSRKSGADPALQLAAFTLELWFRRDGAGTGTNTGTELYWGLSTPVWNDYRDTATLRQPGGTFISALTRTWWP
jgi:hypothetical protein